MLFRRGAVKAPGLVISDRKDFTDSSRRQRQSPGHFCVGPTAPPRLRAFPWSGSRRSAPLLVRCRGAAWGSLTPQTTRLAP